MPDDDGLADAYVAADDRFVRRRARRRTRSATGPATTPPAAGTTSATGAATTGGASVPGAHSHVAGLRWWNVKHPAPYAARLAGGRSPAAGRELLDADQRRVERVLLEVRLAEGLPVDVLTATERRRLPDLAAPRA